MIIGYRGLRIGAASLRTWARKLCLMFLIRRLYKVLLENVDSDAYLYLYQYSMIRAGLVSLMRYYFPSPCLVPRGGVTLMACHLHGCVSLRQRRVSKVKHCALSGHACEPMHTTSEGQMKRPCSWRRKVVGGGVSEYGECQNRLY